MGSSYYHQAPTLAAGIQALQPIQYATKPAPTARSVTDDHACAVSLGSVGAKFHAEEVSSHSYMLPELGDLPSPLPSDTTLASALASAKPVAIVTSSDGQNITNAHKPAFEVTDTSAYIVSYMGNHAGIESSYYHQAPALTAETQ